MKFGLVAAAAALVIGVSSVALAQEEDKNFYIPKFYCVNCGQDLPTTLTYCRPAVAKPGEDCFTPAANLNDLAACKIADGYWKLQFPRSGFRARCTEPDGSVTLLFP